MEVKFRNIGSHIGTRTSGAKVRAGVVSAISKNQKVTFNMKGVEVVSHCFADECFAKLTTSFDLKTIKAHTTFVNASPFVKASIASSFKERLSHK